MMLSLISVLVPVAAILAARGLMIRDDLAMKHYILGGDPAQEYDFR